MSLIKEKKYTEAGAIIHELINMMDEGVEDCPKYVNDDDFAKIDEWSLVLMYPDDLGRALDENLPKNHLGIMNGMATMQNYWSAGDYYQAGRDAESILELSIGMPQFARGSLDRAAVANYIAGFIVGSTADSNFQE